jgi:thiol-disulfide isomerase/thioredoxin
MSPRLRPRSRLLAVLALAGACARDDAPTPSAATTPPPANAVAADLPATAPTPVAMPQVAAPPVATPAPAVLTILEIDAQAGPLDGQLAAIAARAKREDRIATVELWASWCAPCKTFDRLLEAGPVVDALRGTILVRVDVDMFDDELTQMGFTAPKIPSLYRIDARGKPAGKPLSGADWTKRDAGQIAAAVGEFLGS